MVESSATSPNHGRSVFTEIPVNVTLERAAEVGAYFLSILDKYTVPGEIALPGRYGGMSVWPGRKVGFISGNERLMVHKIDDQVPGARRTFPEVVASMYEWNGKETETGRKGWELGDRFLYDLRSEGRLSYRRGHTLMYDFSGRELRPGIEGVQSPARWPHLTTNVTPPSSEGVLATLDNFLESCERIIRDSKQPTHRIRALGRRGLKFLVGPFGYQGR